MVLAGCRRRVSVAHLHEQADAIDAEYAKRWAGVSAATGADDYRVSFLALNILAARYGLRCEFAPPRPEKIRAAVDAGKRVLISLWVEML
jgi:hypothetical protein